MSPCVGPVITSDAGWQLGCEQSAVPPGKGPLPGARGAWRGGSHLQEELKY